MSGNKGRGKILAPKQVQELSEAIQSGGRHAHTRGITMSTRQGKGKGGAQKCPRSEAESNYDVPTNMDTSSAFRDIGRAPTDDSYESSFDHERESESSQHSSDTHTDHSIEEPSEPPPSSSGSVRRKKDIRGRFVGSKASSSGARQKPNNSWILTQPMSGGPVDIRLLKSYGGHVAVDIWQGNSRGVLGGVNRALHCRKLADWRCKMRDEVVHLVDGTEGDGISFLATCLFDHLDVPLLSAFVERWQPDTNTFHLPFREMTITLYDVFHILRIPVEGLLVGCEEQSTPDILVQLSGLLKKTMSELVDESVYGHRGVLTSSIIDSCRLEKERSPEVEASGYLMALLGTTLFPDKSKTRVNPLLYTIVQNFEPIRTYSWGLTTLAYLYRQLGIASRSKCRILGGCLSFFQAWIYEYFHKLRPQRAQLITEPNKPRVLAWDVKLENKHNIRLETFRKILDDYKAEQVTWLPFGPDPHDKVPRTLFEGYIRYFDIIEPYMPDRVLHKCLYCDVGKNR